MGISIHNKSGKKSNDPKNTIRNPAIADLIYRVKKKDIFLIFFNIICIHITYKGLSVHERAWYKTLTEMP